jgi:type IV pilus assembly protein PilM
MDLPFFNSAAKKRDQIVAVDLGGRSTKAVHLQRKGEQFALVSYALLDAPIYEKSFSAHLLSDHLRSLVRELGHPKTKQITLALGVSDTLFRQLELPFMPVEDMRLMLRYNSKNYLQQDLPDHVFDCFYLPSRHAFNAGEAAKTPSAAQKAKVVVGGARKQLLDDIQEGVKDAGMIADQVVPSLIGPVNAFEMSEPEIYSKEVVALVDVGFKNSTISILDCGELVINRVVGIGGDRLTGGLAEMLGISYQEAENIKIGMPAEVEQNLEPLVQPLGRELRASIDFFEHQQDKTVTQVFVSGGSARSEFILQALQNELMVPCKSWNPTRFLQMGLSPQKMGEVEQIAPQLAVALGVASSSF